MQTLLATYFQVGFLLGSFFDPEDEGTCSSETSVDFQRLHSIIYQKIELFLTTDVRTSTHT
jgi:hypothetical protein